MKNLIVLTVLALSALPSSSFAIPCDWNEIKSDKAHIGTNGEEKFLACLDSVPLYQQFLKMLTAEDLKKCKYTTATTSFKRVEGEQPGLFDFVTHLTCGIPLNKNSDLDPQAVDTGKFKQHPAQVSIEARFQGTNYEVKKKDAESKWMLQLRFTGFHSKGYVIPE